MVGKRSATPASTPVRCTIVTLDAHLAGAVEGARSMLQRDLPGLDLRLHVAADWMQDPTAIERCRTDLADADFIVVTHMFMEEQISALLPTLAERRDQCDGIACIMSDQQIVNVTRLGKLRMGGDASESKAWSPAAMFRMFRGGSKKAEGGQPSVPGAPGRSAEAQVRMLKRVPRLLRFVPGQAQDVRAWLTIMRYWLAGSPENIANLVRLLVNRYATGPRAALRGTLTVADPTEYPEVGVYHPSFGAQRLRDDARGLPAGGGQGRVGLLLVRSYLLSGNTAHYDAVIAALEARGLQVVPAFAYGLDQRPAVEQFFLDEQRQATVDAVISLTGFSLVGGPAYNDAFAARVLLAEVDVPYLSLQTLEFQDVAQWNADPRGLNPLQATLQVAIPELDGATGPLVFGGKAHHAGSERAAMSEPVADRVERLAGRVAELVRLRRTARAERRVGIVIFNFPPNAGTVGTAAYLAVFESLQRTLIAMRDGGYTIDVPESADALREALLAGNSAQFGTPANLMARVAADVHVRREPHLAEIEAAWGPAPGKSLTDGRDLFVLGARFGNAAVVVQPPFGYEGDPMRLLFERGFAPTHAFSAFYQWLREDFGAHALLHFGTHGALEFMPGKQVGLTAACWPDRLIGDTPNFYVYAANNPSEGTIAKRRGAATLVSYLTPPLGRAGLYRGLLDLRASLDRWRQLSPDASADERHRLAELVQVQAAQLDLAPPEPVWNGDAPIQIERVREALHEVEHALIPHGLHVVGRPPSPDERADTLLALWDAGRDEDAIVPLAQLLASLGDEDVCDAAARLAVAALVRDGADAAEHSLLGSGLVAREADRARGTIDALATVDRLLAVDAELPAILRALDARYIAPAPGGDLLRTPGILPTGRNVYGFDPYRVPTAAAMREGTRQAELLLARHAAEGYGVPETVALVLWGTDNMKSEGTQLAQALALMGAVPRFDALGRLAGARLLPLTELGRPRVDVVVTVSGIFRDLLPLQIALLAEAAQLAAEADEPLESNAIRRHALAQSAALGVDLTTAALRVFGNAEGAYGANVNFLVESGRWQKEDELGEAWMRRKSVAYGRTGAAGTKRELLTGLLQTADCAFQNVDSVELGATDVDQYVDSLGGMSQAIRTARGSEAPVYMGDATGRDAKVRTLAEQVALETRTRLLNPRWYESMLASGYEGVRQLEARVTTTMGWSATTGAVAPWVYREIGETFVLDTEMRERLATLNPTAASRLAARLLEATDRGYWTPDDATLDALREASEDLEDRLEGVVAAR